jgi:D-amino peptidase
MRLILLCLTLTAAVAAVEHPAILIVTDMEGVGGVNDREEQVLPGQRRFDESKRLLTGEVNAAVAGALRGGAREVVVWDGHDGSRSLSIEDLHPRARLLQGRPTPANYYMSDRAYDGIMFVGQHAMAGAPGIMAHSQSSATIAGISINGRPVGEIGQVAAIGGYFNIPVIMLSGDDTACDEILKLQPKAETVAVKSLIGKASSLSLSHTEARARIEAAAERAVKRLAEYRPWKIEGPIEMKFEYFVDAPGTVAAGLSTQGKNIAPKVVTYRGRTVLEAFEQLLGKLPADR